LETGLTRGVALARQAALKATKRVVKEGAIIFELFKWLRVVRTMNKRVCRWEK
jgi:hypothetical protein